MSYVFYPPRTQNFFPPGPPYLAGVRGLGDYDADMKSYRLKMLAYNRSLLVYEAQKKAYAEQMTAIKADNMARSQTIAKSYGFTLPQSYFDNGACLTQNQHNIYVAECVTVKGLGSSSIDCGYKALPVCNYPSPPGPPGPPPIAPKAPVVVTTTSTPVVTPTATVPTATPDPFVPPAVEPVSEEEKRASMVRNGLLLVAVIGGGYLVYRTIKKPKAA